MRYSLDNQAQADQAKEYLNQAIRNKWKIELIRKSNQRSLPQNAFFHLLCTYLGNQLGYTKDEAKTYIKRHMSDVFVYEKNGNKFMRSSADLNQQEMSAVMERLYMLAADLDVVLPLVENEETYNLLNQRA
jgi:hypothetical protein